MPDKFAEIGIEYLKLDPENPRLPDYLRGTDKKTTLPNWEDDVINWMLTEMNLLDLLGSISQNDFFAGEPIIVRDDNDGTFTVLEGNRRLSAVKLLAKSTIAKTDQLLVTELANQAKELKHIPTKIWVYVVEDRKYVDNYLGFRHVSGVKSWPVIAKARYLNELYVKKKRTDVGVFRELAKEIGSKSTYVRRLLYGYKLYVEIKERHFYGMDLDESTFNLSLITDAATMHNAIAEYMGINYELENPFAHLSHEKLKEVAEWLYKRVDGKTRVGENRNLRILNKVLQNAKARDFFLSGKELQLAAEFTDLTEENLRSYLNGAKANIASIQALLHNISSPTDAELRDLDELIRACVLIKGDLSYKLELAKAVNKIA